MQKDLNTLPHLDLCLEQTAALHKHLCPRQVLGVRMGLCAARLLDLPLPQEDKRLYVFVETDGCFADGVSVATGCWLGRRTMRLVDFGKVASTFVDTHTGRAIRISPHLSARTLAMRYAPDTLDAWHAQLVAYQVMPEGELLQVQEVRVMVDMAAIISSPGLRVSCDSCGEEIMNGREVSCEGVTLCKGCAKQDNYYSPVPIE